MGANSDKLSEADDLVREIHNSGKQLVLATTGGGSGVIEQLLSVPGASRTVLEARVPYAATAMNDWLRGVPESYCSKRTARAMAMSAFQRADCLSGVPSSEGGTPLVGIGATASLASDRAKRGPHRVHAAFQTSSTTAQVTLELEKGARSRRDEEQLVAALLLNVVAEGCGVDARVELPLTENDSLEVRKVTAAADWQKLLSGELQRVAIGPAAGSATDSLPITLFPGAFDPRHSGHREMAEIARRVLGCPVTHEMSIENVDKRPLDFIEIEDRLAQFDVNETVWLTRSATFIAKAKLFPGTTFIVGADTLRRVAEPKYYERVKMTVDDAIDQLVAADCRFLLFGRVASGQFYSLADLSLPKRLVEICQEVPESEFRDDVSSTFLRSQAAGDD